MNKETYLQTLRAKLTGNIGPREIDDAIAYYSEYFEDAGPEREQEVIAELGHPAYLARQIIGDQLVRYLAEEPDNEQQQRQQQTGAAGQGQQQRQGTPPPKKRSGLSLVWIVILAICASPVAIPVAVAMVSLAVAMVIAVLAVVVGIGVGGLVCIAAGLVSIVLGFSVLFYSFPSTLVSVGGGLAALGAGALLIVGVIALAEFCLVGIARLFSRQLAKKGGKRG